MTDILSETLSKIIETARGSDRADKNVAVVTLPNNKFAIVNQLGKTVSVETIDPPKRTHALLSVSQVLAWAKSQLALEPIIWVGDDKIVVTLDDEFARTRGDHAAYEWKFTPEFALLQEMSRGNPATCQFQQAALIRLLRTTFWESFRFTSERDELIKSLRMVVAQQASNLQQGRGTYEATMATANTGESVNWPERIELMVNVFQDAEINQQQRVGVVFEVDPHSKSFTLLPVASNLTQAIDITRREVVESIRNELQDDDGIQIFLGKP